MFLRLRFFQKVNNIRYFATDPSEVIFKEVNKCGIIILNRPKALNSLNLNMANLIHHRLMTWASNKNINHIVIEGSGDKAFCSGGDIREVVIRPIKESSMFFEKEYKLNYLIGTLGKPYISLLNGIVMGGGFGLSVHGTDRIVTEKTLFAMPETAIGLFPDVGGSYILPRLKRNIGMYMALVGQRLKGRDILTVGIGTHFVSSNKINELKEELIAASTKSDIDFILNKYHEVDKEYKFSLLPFMDFIKDHFSKTSVEQILESLSDKIDSPSVSTIEKDWCQKQIEVLQKMCPTSLKVTFRQLTEGKNMSFRDCLTMEYRIAVRCLENKNFREGVRALIIDKDNKPIWEPSSIDKVTSAMVDQYFKPLSNDLNLL